MLVGQGERKAAPAPDDRLASWSQSVSVPGSNLRYTYMASSQWAWLPGGSRSNGGIGCASPHCCSLDTEDLG